MNRKKKNIYFLLTLFSILGSSFFELDTVKAGGIEDVIVEIDHNGSVLKGTEISLDKPIVRPAYQGNYTTIFNNVIGPKGYFTGFFDFHNSSNTIKFKQKYLKGENLIVKNLGQYNGRKIALKITFLATGTTGAGSWETNLPAYLLKDGEVGVEVGVNAEDVPIQYQLVYDEPGSPIVRDIYLDLPSVFGTGETNGLRHPAVNISLDNLKKAFFNIPSPNWNQTIQRTYSSVSKMVDKKNIEFLNVEFNTLNNIAADPDVSIVSINNEPTILILKSVIAKNASMTVFKSDMKVPYIPNYLPIRANGEGNSDKFEAKYDIGQTVVDAYPDYLPESLKIVIEDTEGYFANLTPETLEFTDKDGKKITDIISVGEALNDKLELTLSKENLKKLKANQVNIKLSFDELNLEKLLSNYNSAEKLYKIPLTFYNIRNAKGKEVESERTKVEASISPNIYGEANPTTVSLGSSSTELNPIDLIKNGLTTIPEDNLKVSILDSTFFDEFKTYPVKVKLESTENPSLTKTIQVPVKVEEPLEEGWELGSETDFILDQGYKLEWAKHSNGNQGGWWYTFQGKSWMFVQSIEAALLVNNVFPSQTSDVPREGFLWKFGAQSEYTRNRTEKILKRTFLYLSSYKIEISQQLLGNHAIEVTYRVTNLNESTQKIGLSQYVDVYVGTDRVPVTPINNFKGINLTDSYTGDSFVMMPDQQTMPNWAAGNVPMTQKMRQYDLQNAYGVGWETGERYRNPAGTLLNPPQKLKENQAIQLSDSAISIKNGGVNVASKEYTSFKQILKFGKLVPPKVTLDQTNGILYNGDTMDITGSISDEDNLNYRLYLEMDDAEKTLIPLEEYANVPYNEINGYQATLKAEDFSLGEHNLSIIGIDEYGARSVPQKLNLRIFELNGIPIIQKIKLGEQIPQTDLSTIFSNIRRLGVHLKTSLDIDSSSVGFQWIDAILIDENLRELPIKLPVNIYNPESTVFNDEDELALDAPDVNFELTTVRQAEKDKSLDELVFQQVAPVAWDITDGSRVFVLLLNNAIKPIFGNYQALFEANNGAKLQKEIQIAVGGELKFKELPSNLTFKTSKLGWGEELIQRSESDWKIEIENTLGSSWFLKASASPFKNQTKEQLKHGLIFKDKENQIVQINSDSQLIAIDDGEVYPLIQWEDRGGLLLKLNPAAKIGLYQGEIMWELTDAP